MANGQHGFEHLPLLFREHGPARLGGGGSKADETKAARADRPAHATKLTTSATTISQGWKTRQDTRNQAGQPVLPAGVPLLLKIDPDLDVDALRHYLGFEIVSEEEEGFVIVASDDVELASFLAKINDFTTEVTGSAIVASVHELDDDPSQDQRLRRILSETLYAEWGRMDEDQEYICDIGIACTGDWQIRKQPKRGRMKESTWAAKCAEWAEERREAYDNWEQLQTERLNLIREFTAAYGGSIVGIYEDDAAVASASLPDSFTVRLRLVAKGLRDLVLNCAYVFEVVEPDDIETPQAAARAETETMQAVQLVPPSPDAPSVCVIDSGVQEGHFWLQPAIDTANSMTLIDEPDPSVADRVAGGGHGTRVAGAILYGGSLPTAGQFSLPCWIQNARILNHECVLPDTLFPPQVIRKIVTDNFTGTRRTRIFNHSVNADAPCRTRHMSAWAAELDRLSGEFDVLIVQSMGNLKLSREGNRPGIRQLLQAGKSYPAYLNEPGCRLANPAQSFQALSVGSVARTVFEGGGWKSFATEVGMPSGFSRPGLGLWGCIKPEVVEYGGDCLRDTGNPPNVSTPTVARECYPELVRSTADGGPGYDRDQVGTSFAAPLVSRIAAAIQAVLPDHSCLLYRGLIVQSARWPEWAHGLPADQKAELFRRIGYGVPDMDRATTNSDYRTTFITDDEREIGPGDCHIYQIRIPEELRRAGADFEIRIDATLSYVAEPRRTRRRHRGYLSVWADWISSRKDERLDAFLTRAIKGDDKIDEGSSFGWSVETQPHTGAIPETRRSVGTVQKDWTTLKSNELPSDLCFAVRGHQGWSHDPDAAARYVFAVTIDVVGEELAIYEPLRVSVEELQAELGVEVEVEVEEAGGPDT